MMNDMPRKIIELKQNKKSKAEINLKSSVYPLWEKEKEICQQNSTFFGIALIIWTQSINI